MRFYLVNDINIYIFVESNNNNKHIMKKYKVREVIKLLEAEWMGEVERLRGRSPAVQASDKKRQGDGQRHESEDLSHFY